MNKELIQKIVNGSPFSFAQIIKTHHLEEYNFIKDNYEGDSFSEKCYRYLNPDENKMCLNCKGKVKFLGFNEGYRKYC